MGISSWVLVLEGAIRSCTYILYYTYKPSEKDWRSSYRGDTAVECDCTYVTAHITNGICEEY
jgi:hypothetical protein